ncbi:DUF6443 domain-containing protein [Mucilaginibacter gossypii]|uniref:DUF6443 domain-containing protein n=1 Tax=Mucilaginibacter gossypii TaxID=551996 RepID=UPI000DCCDB55|nr:MULTISPECIES: DUF6443 domain-containing protein [Mucilaginibacter]QTE36360.1 DUF6443 domain-containing protein [Mucilaginibacter gossypii]RAV55857.1 hypothetical protein DIU36_16195 [Mucilaginibacter rubeus]
MRKIFCLLLLLAGITNRTLAQGTTMGTAINAGSYSTSGNYSDTKNNSTGFVNNYGQASNDVWYTFTISGATNTVLVSLCGSSFDTYLHVLNSGGTEIATNDDNGPLCTGTQSSLSLSNLAPGTYYVDAEGYSNNTGAIAFSLNVTIVTPLSISYASPQTYSVGTAITTLSPSLSGGTVPAAGQTSTFAGITDNFNQPLGATVDASGNVYIAEGGSHVIRKITPAGQVSVFAGSYSQGFTNGTGTSASFYHPVGLSADASGNIYVADEDNNAIRKITPAGVVTTFAGNGAQGSADGAAASATFYYPCGVAVDGSGNVYVADAFNNKIRKITSAGVVSTLAGSGTASSVDGTGTSATFNQPFSVVTDASGNIYVTDRVGAKIRKVTPAGVVTTLAGSGTAGFVDGTGSAASFNAPTGLAIDKAGNLYVADETNNRIRKITPAGVVTTLSGTGAQGSNNDVGTASTFNLPFAIAADAGGLVYVGDFTTNLIRKIVATPYTVSPALPAGLSLNNATGVISGTPSAAKAQATYTVTANNNNNSATVPLVITVNAAPTPSLSQDQNYVVTYIPNRSGINTDARLDGLKTNKDSVQTTIQYLDGLGRPLQTVRRQASPTARDIVQPFVYDQYEREAFKYLPYAASSTAYGTYRTDALATGAGDAQFYNPSGNPATTVTQQTNGVVNTAYPFTQSIFDASPENRVIEEGAPGTAWQLSSTPGTGSSNHSVKVVISNNTDSTFTTSITNNNGSRRVAFYTAAINTNQSRKLGRTNNTAVYDNNQLMVTITRNENWKPGDGCFNTMEEYKDKEGHLVLKRTYNLKVTGTTAAPVKTAEMLSTYYVYDDLGNLSFVLPPGANPDATASLSQATIDNACYQYRYDTRNRLVQKKIPGKGWEYIIYNTLDLPVATQDSVQRMKSPQEWTITKYDAMGRTVLIGLYQYGSTAGMDNHATIQGFADVQSAQWETPVATGNGYTTNTWPTTWTTTLGLNYYDSYAGIPSFPGTYDQTANPTFSKQTNGLLTASKTLVLNTSGDYLWHVPYYDNEGQVIKSFTQHYVGGGSALSLYNYDADTTTYNYLKLPTQIKRSHYLKNTGGTTGVLTLTETNYYSYDHVGRKLGTSHQMRDGSNASQATIILARSDYNEVGQFRYKRLHSVNSGANWLQTIDYRYNARGWLSSINNANLNSDGGLTNNDTNDKFGEELSYDATTSVTKQYNGNIATAVWKSAPIIIGGTTITPVKQTYDYGYDNLNRLRSAVSTSSTTAKDNLYGENVTYDNMGNITGLGRYDNISGKTQIDTLTYTYSNYKVTQVDDASSYAGTAGFQDPVKQANEYTYDGNGNELKDMNKSISSITYNTLNLPQTITKADGSTITYVYSASGNKLRKILTAGGNTTITEYDNGIQYDNSTTTVAFIQTEEGRARKSGSAYVYEYDLKDHLGNTRVILTPDPADGTQQTAKLLQENDYYAFGYGIQSTQQTISPKNEYLYNHKELQEETGLYDYGARFYDPVIGRFISVDPLAEKMRRFSTYDYADDNPIRNIDPDGRRTTTPSNPGPDNSKAKIIREILQDQDLSETYYVNSKGRLYIKKAWNLFSYLSKITSTAALVFLPLETSDHDDIPKEATQNRMDDEADQKDYKANPKVATDDDGSGRKYLTYTKKRLNADGSITVYSGRTSGRADETDDAILRRRDATHHMNGFGDAVIDRSSKNRFAIRGREQQLIDFFGRAQSDGGTSGNRIRGVSKVNPLGRIYHAAANAKFGQLSKFTGY